MRTQKITGAVQALVSILAIVAAPAHAATPATPSVDASRIAVTDVAGHVDVTMAGQAVAVHRDSTVLLPARIVTGHDGMLGMTQAGTRITVSNDTDVEIPAEAVDGNLVARLVQHQGNVFYDVAPRDLGKLRVETPFLVAVIKGTQFNVTVQADRTTISLFEGQLEILTPDGSDVIQLDAGEIAIRSLLDDAIRIVGMDDESVAVPPADARTTPTADVAAAVPEAGADAGVVAKPGVAAVAKRDGVGATVVDVRVDKKVDSDVGVLVAVDHGRPQIDAGAAVGVGIGTASLDTDVGADLDLGSVVAGLDTNLDLGATLDLGGALDLDVDLQVDLDAGTSAETVDQTTAPELPRLLPPGLLGRP